MEPSLKAPSVHSLCPWWRPERQGIWEHLLWPTEHRPDPIWFCPQLTEMSLPLFSCSTVIQRSQKSLHWACAQNQEIPILITWKCFHQSDFLNCTQKSALRNLSKLLDISSCYIPLLGLIANLSYPLQVILIYTVHSTLANFNSLSFWKCVVEYQINGTTKTQLMIPKFPVNIVWFTIWKRENRPSWIL